MPENESQVAEFDWTLTSFEGSRRKQLRRWAQLPLENVLLAIEEMQDISQQLGTTPTTSRSGQVVSVKEQAAEYGQGVASHEIALSGCTPEPLVDYLKALGVLRLVAEQADPDARGFWRNSEFILKSQLDLAGLQEFFIERYRPSAIVVPWSGNDFFSVRPNQAISKKKAAPSGSNIIEAFLSCHSERLLGYRQVIEMVLRAFEELGIQKKSQIEKPAVKAGYLAYLRSHAPEHLVPWLDSAAVLEKDKASFSALLGSGGGSDGNTHFSDNFMQNLWDVLPDFGEQKTSGTGEGKSQDGGGRLSQSRHWLIGSLCGSSVRGLIDKRTSSLFDAGAVGGPNATQGMERKAMLNPWNFILALEGSICFSGALTKRVSTAKRGSSSFPFQVRLSVSNDNRAAKKETAGREIWLPLWNNPVKFKEVEEFLAQGRIELNGKMATRGVDAARAIASLGIDQGISAFQRYAIVKGRVGGDNYNTAASMGCFGVRAQQYVDLLREADAWLSAFRRACNIGSKEEAPARFTSALRRINSAIFDYCRYGGRADFQAILIALGRAERELMRDGRWAVAGKNHVPPLYGLSADWIEASRDSSSEYELALALANIRGYEKVRPLRANLEPVRIDYRKDGTAYASWTEKGRAVVWNQSDLSSNLAAVLARRMQDAAGQAHSRLPLWSPHSASPGAIAAFLSGQTDDNRLEDLLWGLLLIDPSKGSITTKSKAAGIQAAPPLSRSYALLKPLFLPVPIVYQVQRWRYARRNELGIAIHPEPRILPLLRAGRINEAAGIAGQRLRASGLQPMITRGERGWRQEQGQRLAAALLFPIDSYLLDRLLRLIVREDSIATRLSGEPA